MDITVNQSMSNSTFGCCHRFRQCSDAKKCLLLEEDSQHAQLCSYRINLEQGNIFYGKNAKGFSIEQYTELLQSYNSTNGSTRCVLDDIILYFAGNLYLSSHVLWFYSPDIETLSALGFITYYRNHKAVLEKYPMKDLRAASGSKLRKKDEIINYIISDKPDVLSQLSDLYCYLQIPKQNRQYIYELYYDLFHSTSNNRYLGSIPFANKKLDGNDSAQ